MNKTNMILICVTIALISGIIGFIIGINFKGNNEINLSSVSIKNEERNLVGNPDRELSEEEKEFEKYCKLYEERFGNIAYIAEPNGTMQKTIEAIKICLEKNEDILDKLLYPDFDEKFLY